MDINTSEFVLLIDRAENGPSAGRGWGLYEHTCPFCQKRYLVVAMIGTVAAVHCECGYAEEDVWGGADDQMPCDGAWLEPVFFEQEKIINLN